MPRCCRVSLEASDLRGNRETAAGSRLFTKSAVAKPLTGFYGPLMAATIRARSRAMEAGPDRR